MKKLLLISFCLGVMGLMAPQAVAASAVSSSSTSITIEHAPAELSKKELRQQRRMERRAERRMKWAERIEKLAPNALEGNLRYALLALAGSVIFWVAAVVFGIIGIPILGSVLSILASLAGLAAVVFFVLWLVEEIG